MDRVIPWELSNKIYKYRAHIILINKLNEYQIDHKKFNKFLRSQNAFVMGSFCLSCFDNTWNGNDIDIFVAQKNSSKYIYKEFCKTFNKTDIDVKIGKHALSNSSIDNDPSEYLYKLYVCKKTIDIVILKPINQSNISNYLNIECSNIIFDGTDWKFPTNIDDIGKFLITKRCAIGNNAYCSYFADIYDPWRNHTFNSLIESSYHFTLPRKHSITDNMMRNIYEKLVVYYPEVNNSKYKTNCCYIVEYHLLDSFDLTVNGTVSIGDNNTINLNDSYDEISQNFGNYCGTRIDSNNIVNCTEKYLRVASIVSKNFNQPSEMKCSTFVRLYNIYRTWYRILKYISRGYIFVDIDELMERDFANVI